MSIYPIRGGSAMWPVQQVIFSVLSADAALQQMANGIYDGEVPQEEDVRMPYVVIGDTTELGRDLLAVSGREVSQIVNVYSNYQGAKEAKLIMDRVISLLDRRESSLNVPGWDIHHVQLEFNEILQEPDSIRHAIVRFRIRVQKRAA